MGFVGNQPDQILPPVGAVVGTTDTQTLTNKTLASPAVTGAITFSDATSISTASSLGLRNRIINGGMQIDQRNSGALQTLTAGAAIAYCVDRFYTSCTGANVTVQQTGPIYPYPHGLTFTGLASNTGTLLGQRIESENCRDLYNKTVTGSLSVSSTSITTLTWTAYYANSINTFSAKTQIATGTITISSTQTAYNFSFNAGTNVLNGICIEFTTGALLGSQTLIYTGVQLEPGSTATPFETRPYGLELALCQRYYYRLTSLGTSDAFGTTAATGATTAQGYIPFPVEMRTVPASIDQTGVAADYTLVIAAATSNCSAVPTMATSTSQRQGVALLTVASGLTTGQAGVFRTNAVGKYLGWSAEL